jgi:hypothetical protein
LERGLGVDANPEVGLNGEGHDNPEMGDGQPEEIDDNPFNIYDFLDAFCQKNSGGRRRKYNVSQPFRMPGRDRDRSSTLDVVGGMQTTPGGTTLYKQFRVSVHRASDTTLRVEGYYVGRDREREKVDRVIPYQHLVFELGSLYEISAVSASYPNLQ